MSSSQEEEVWLGTTSSEFAFLAAAVLTLGLLSSLASQQPAWGLL
jgi:hypothetical protein